MGNVINVILSGGFGTRLWPLSTPDNPKQFLKIFNGKSLFQKTLERNSCLVDKNMILTNAAHYNLALEQINEINKNFDYKILEPLPRNTAPAITLAALSVNENDILFVTPSDHIIADKEIYHKCVREAINLAKEGSLVTFSIKPTYAETGYGYIEFDGNKVLSFREKPDENTAKEFIKSGRFNWNSGMFCFRAGTFLNEIKKHSPEIWIKSFDAFKKGIDVESMGAIPSESVDYAVFEKSDKIKTVPSNFQWNDLGNFNALVSYLDTNDFINNPLSKIEGIGISNSYSIGEKKVLGIGVKDLIVVETEGAILILPKGECQKVKQIYDEFKYD